MGDPVEVRLGRALAERGWTLSVAETTAGGLICARIVAVPGCSAYFERGIVAYSRASKVDALGVDEGLLTAHGAASREVAIALAEGVRRIGGTTLGLAETGIAGPIRGRSPKPIGSAFIALSTPDGARCEASVFEGGRQRIREQIADRALTLALACVELGLLTLDFEKALL